MTRMLTALVAVLTLASSLVPNALASNAPASSNVGHQIDAYLQRYMLTAKQPGVSAVVIQNDDVLLRAAYGFADRDAGRLMTTQTPVAIGSTSKGMTALAVMQLVEQGLVDL